MGSHANLGPRDDLRVEGWGHGNGGSASTLGRISFVPNRAVPSFPTLHPRRRQLGVRLYDPLNLSTKPGMEALTKGWEEARRR